MKAIVAYQRDGEFLSPDEDGPLRLFIIGENNNHVVDGHWTVKWVSQIRLKPMSEEWSLYLEGARTETMDRNTFESCSAPGCHQAVWEDEEGNKWTGVPLYYLAGQEQQLERFSDNLGEKEKKVYDLLNEKKILRDSDLVPVFRAAIRSVKDFAFPFTVNFQSKKELFWKWYNTSKEEAETKVKKILGIKDKPKTEVQKKLEEKKIEKGDAALLWALG